MWRLAVFPSFLLFLLIFYFHCGILVLASRFSGCPACRSRFLSGSLFWGCPVSVSAPAPSSVVRSARAWFAPWSGAALGVSFRPSRLAWSGFVAVVRFSSFPAAACFSRSWGPRCGAGFCAVRSVPAAAGLSPSWCVSVPVAPPPALVGRGRASRALAALFAARCGVAAPAVAYSQTVFY